MTREEAIERVKHLRKLRIDHIVQSTIEMECASDCRREAERLSVEFHILEREVSNG